MTVETLEKAIRFGFANSSCWLDLTFFGGEPLLEKPLLFHAVEYARQYKERENIALPLRYFVTTNGLLLDEAFMRTAAEKKIKVTVSLDGYGEGHDATRKLPDGSGSFALLEARFAEWLRCDPNLEVLMTATPANVARLADGIEKLFARGFRLFFLGCDHEGGWTEGDLDRLRRAYEALGELYCRCMHEGRYLYLSPIDGKIATRTRPQGELCACCDKNDGEIAVAPSGNLYPCLRFVKCDEDETLRLGSIDTGLDRKRRAAMMVAAAREWAECEPCQFRGRCFHYCMAVNHKVTGRFNQPPGSLCRVEQTAIGVADAVAERLYAERNPMFMQRFYGN